MIYIVVSSNEIVKAEMGRPNIKDYNTGIDINIWAHATDLNKWQDHCLSLPRIAIQGKHNWEVWQSVPESEVMEKLQYLSYDEKTWIPANGRTESQLHYIKRPYRTVAIPIEQTKSEQGEKVNQQSGNGWVEFKEDCPLPDYDEYVLWLFEDGNMNVECLDKDGNPWLYGGEKDEAGYHLDPKVTHWRPLPPPPY